MAATVDVPLNTVIADLDEALRRLLRRELERHGFEGVEIAFDAPSKDWSGKLTSPTVDLFLYDLREATERASMSPTERRGNGRASMSPPPLRLELTYAVTAWTKAVEDEHRLLSQVLSILFSHRRLPADLLAEGTFGSADGLADAETSVGRPREEKADFWSAVGGQYKASIDFVVHLVVESGASTERGPEVRTADDADAARRRPGADAHRAAPARRHAARRRGRARGGRLGRGPGDRALERHGRGRAVPLRADVAGLASARGAHGGGRAGGGQVLGARRCRRPHAEEEVTEWASEAAP